MSLVLGFICDGFITLASDGRTAERVAGEWRATGSGYPKIERLPGGCIIAATGTIALSEAVRAAARNAATQNFDSLADLIPVAAREAYQNRELQTDYWEIFVALAGKDSAGCLRVAAWKHKDDFSKHDVTHNPGAFSAFGASLDELPEKAVYKLRDVGNTGVIRTSEQAKNFMRHIMRDCAFKHPNVVSEDFFCETIERQAVAAAPGSAFLKIEGDDWIDTNKRVADPRRLLASHVSYRPLTNPLTATDAGATATINIAAFTMRVAGLDLSLNAGSISTLSFDTLYFIYYDDAGFAGGSPAGGYQATTVKETALNGTGRFFVGSIFTPKDSGPDTIGAGDGGSGAQIGLVSSIQAGSSAPVAALPQFTNPFNTIDSNLTNFAVGQDSDVINVAKWQWWHNFGPNTRQRAKSIKLKIESEVIKTGGGSVRGRVMVSDNFAEGSFTGPHSSTVFSVDASRSKQIDEVSLPGNINLGNFAVRADADYLSGTATVDVRIYNVWVQIED